MKCMFVADDGREFESEEENKKKKEEKKRRYNEVDAAWDKYKELCKKYYEDYKDDEWLNPEHEDEDESDKPLSAEEVMGDLLNFIFS